MKWPGRSVLYTSASFLVIFQKQCDRAVRQIIALWESNRPATWATQLGLRKRCVNSTGLSTLQMWQWIIWLVLFKKVSKGPVMRHHSPFSANDSLQHQLQHCFFFPSELITQSIKGHERGQTICWSLNANSSLIWNTNYNGGRGAAWCRFKVAETPKWDVQPTGCAETY